MIALRGLMLVMVLLLGWILPIAAAPAPAWLITPGVGAGPIKVGMNVSDVVAILGTPKITQGVSGGGARYSWYEVINRGGPGVEAVFLHLNRG